MMIWARKSEDSNTEYIQYLHRFGGDFFIKKTINENAYGYHEMSRSMPESFLVHITHFGTEKHEEKYKENTRRECNDRGKQHVYNHRDFCFFVWEYSVYCIFDFKRLFFERVFFISFDSTMKNHFSAIKKTLHFCRVSQKSSLL